MKRALLWSFVALMAAACTELPTSKYQYADDSRVAGDMGSADATGDGTNCPAADELAAFNLERINQLRRGRWAEELVVLTSDNCLEDIAWRSLDEWLQGGRPHGLFERQCLEKVPECECYWEQENIGKGSGDSWKQAIDKILGLMMAEEFYDGGHFRNIVSARWTIVGIAVDCKVDAGRVTIQLTNEFGP